jgi:hypothetical protein
VRRRATVSSAALALSAVAVWKIRKRFSHFWFLTGLALLLVSLSEPHSRITAVLVTVQRATLRSVLPRRQAGRRRSPTREGRKGWDLFRNCHVDEIESYALRLGQLARLVEERWLQPRRKIAFSHDFFSNRLTASPDDITAMPNCFAEETKSRWTWQLQPGQLPLLPRALLSPEIGQPYWLSHRRHGVEWHYNIRCGKTRHIEMLSSRHYSRLDQ